MRKNSLLWSLTAATMLFFASCENENIPGDTAGKPASVEITIASTRGIDPTPQPGSQDESKISHFEAYVFKKSTGTQLSYVKVDNGVKTTSLNAEEGSVVIAVVANDNIGSVANLAALEKAISNQVLSKTTSTQVPKKADNSTVLGFVMSATMELTLVEGTNPATIILKRTVSKFLEPNFEEAILDLSGLSVAEIQTVLTTFPEGGNKNTIVFEYRKFALANGLNKTLVLNEKVYPITGWPEYRTDWNPSFPFTYLNSKFRDSDPAGKGFYDAEGVYSKEFANIPVYVHENYPYPDYEDGNVTGYNPKEVYCFIVEGRLKYNEEVRTRYWRINLVKSTNKQGGGVDYDYYNIFRNGLYMVNVGSIKSIGHETPEEAENEVPVIPKAGDATVSITVNVANWAVFVSDTDI